LRTLALAYKHSDQTPAELGSGLTLLALVGLLDPPRHDVGPAILECKSAGIKVVMVTGDHPATARNIALQLGITENTNELVINGKNMADADHLDEPAKKQWLSTSIFARVSPKQKLDLVTVFQNDQQVVGMTGDGINDAPALKKADIGIAMGQRGTQVAQQVADMVLKDDRFTSIVTAIRQGRAIYENIRKFVIYLLSCNLSELFVVAIASILNFHFQLFPLQILFINIVTDVMPALALGVTEPNSLIMSRPPRNTKELLIGNREWYTIFIYSGILTVFCLGAVLYSHYTIHKYEPLNWQLCNNVMFYTLMFSQLWHVLNMATERKGWFFNTEVTKNKYVWLAMASCLAIIVFTYMTPTVRQALSVGTMTFNEWLIALSFSLGSLTVTQILKRTKIIN
jgi:Ca2+-transporting ATPase